MPFKSVAAEDIPEGHPVRAFLKHFEEHKAAGDVMSGRDFDPLHVASLLPWLLILDALPRETPPIYRYRFAGPKCCELFGIDYTGKLLGDDLPAEAVELRREEFHQVIERRVPLFSLASIPLAGKEHIQIYRGVFPLAKQDEDFIDQLHVVVAPIDEISD
jgi:hypothetical protein